MEYSDSTVKIKLVEALQSLTTSFIRAQGRADLLQSAIEMVAGSLNAGAGSIYLIDEEDRLVVRASYTPGRSSGTSMRHSIGERAKRRIAQSTFLYFKDSRGVEAFCKEINESASEIRVQDGLPITNMVVMPIILEEQLLGLWIIENLAPSASNPLSTFTEEDSRALAPLSLLLAFSIERESFKGNLISDLKLLAKSSIGIEKASSEEDAILAVMLALEESEFSESLLSLYDRDSKQIRGHLASKGVKADTVNLLRVDASSDDLLAVVLRGDKPLFFRKPDTQRRNSHSDPPGWNSQYVIPLSADDEPLGVLQIHLGEVEKVDEDTELILQAFAGHLSISISRARSITRSLNLTNQVMSGSRFIVAETLSAMAVHSLGHKLDDILSRLNEDLKKREVRERRELLHPLTAWKDILTAGQSDLKKALSFVRDTNPTSTKQVISVHPAIQEALSTWFTLIRQNKCAVHHDLIAVDSEIMITPHAFREIIAVLIVNSIQAHAKNIEIRTYNQFEVELPHHNYIDRALALEIEDDGVGLLTTSPEEIFEPTYTSKPEKFGTGLGLFIARRLSRQSGGDLSFIGKNKKGTGAVFRMVMSLA